MSVRQQHQRATAFVGGTILTMDSSDRAAQAVVIDGGRIIAVGDRGIVAHFPGASIVELGGRTLVPGFIDAHTHLCIAALHPRWADLSGIDSPDGLRTPLLEHAAAEPGAEWVRCVG